MTEERKSSAALPPIVTQAMLAHIQHQISLGNVRRCKAIGLDEEALDALQRCPQNVLARLINTLVPWYQIMIDKPVLTRLIERASQDVESEEIINQALKLGASSSIMLDCFGLSYQETSFRRRILGIAPPKGRRRELTDAERAVIWQRWERLRINAINDELLDRLDSIMMIAEELRLNLTSVWNEVFNKSYPSEMSRSK